MIKPISIILGATFIGLASYFILRKKKDKPTLLDREVYGFWDNEEDDIYAEYLGKKKKG